MNLAGKIKCYALDGGEKSSAHPCNEYIPQISCELIITYEEIKLKLSIKQKENILKPKNVKVKYKK